MLLDETAKMADSAHTALSQMLGRCNNPAPAPGPPKAKPSSDAAVSDDNVRAEFSRTKLPVQSLAPPAPRPASEVFILHFDYKSTEVDLEANAALQLAGAVKDAQLVMVRARTDGAVETAGESRTARARADAVRDYLLALGVPQERIRSTYQPVGDHIGDNNTAAGRALNRRAEVEIYRSAPPNLLLAQSAN
jgi:outer membrane protein OmpA-like peptidoglycan-associated protein